MKTPINDGGPAFPLINEHTHPTTINNGMTLRDYFAGQALAGIAPYIDREIDKLVDREIDKLDTNGKYFDNHANAWYQCAAIRAYCYADAMLASRERKEDAP